MLDLTIYAVPFLFILIVLEILIGNWKKTNPIQKVTQFPASAYLQEMSWLY